MICSNIFKYWHGDPASGILGIEIETEVSSVSAYPYWFAGWESDDGVYQMTDEYSKNPMAKYWDALEDGSLREIGVEWVTNRPMGLIQIKNALNVFGEQTKGIPFLQNSPGTSVHVHQNIQNLTIKQLMSLIGCMFFFENILVEYCGERRRSSCFALPSRVAYGNYVAAEKIMAEIQKGSLEPFKHLDLHALKYGAINLFPIKSLGSLEVRCHPGTTNIDEIKRWIDILVAVRNYAMKNTPSDLIEMYEEKGAMAVLDEVFGNLALFLPCGLAHELIDRSIWHVATFSDKVDWDHLGDKCVKARNEYDAKMEAIKAEQKVKYKKMLNSYMISDDIDVQQPAPPIPYSNIDPLETMFEQVTAGDIENV